MVQAALFVAVNDRFHVGHGGREQRAHADDVRSVLLGGGQEFFDALVHADVVDPEPRAFGHHADEVLANVVEVAADSSHEQDAGGLDTGILRREQGLQYGHARFHGARSNQHLGHIKHVVFEILADDAHAGDQAFAQNFLNAPALGQRVAGHLLDLFGFAFVEALVH